MSEPSKRLPPKTRYDDPIPEGAPIEQWRWLITNWVNPTRAIAKELVAFDKEIASVAAKREALATAGGAPREADQRAILAELEETTQWRGGIYPRRLDAEEALCDIEKMQERLTSELKIDPAKFAAKIARFNAHVEAMEAADKASFERLKEEATKVIAACPDYYDLSGEYPMFAFFAREHCGGPQPKGWTTVSKAW